MALSCGIRDLEKNKFKEDGNGDVAVNTIVSSGEISGTFTPSGLNVELKVTTLVVGDTAVALPATALDNRNSISIQNKSSNTIYIGNSDVTADTVVGTTSGFELLPNGFINFDITDNVVLYGRCETGQSATVKVLELA